MKNKFHILLNIFFGFFLSNNSFAQIADSNSLQKITIFSDSLSISELLDSVTLNFFETQYISEPPNPCSGYSRKVYVPNCTELKLINGIWCNSDSSAYCGACVVKFNNEKTGAIATDIYIPACGKKPEYPVFGCMSNLLSLGNSKGLKILSFYENGYRHGYRQYFDNSGKSIKTEFYEKGRLIKTVYSKNL